MTQHIECKMGGGSRESLDSSFYIIPEYYNTQNSQKDLDLLVCRHVIEHLPNPLILLQDLYNLLKDSTNEPLIFFETPRLEWIIEHEAMYDFFYEHCNYFSKRSLEVLFFRANFRVVEIVEGFEGQYYLIFARPCKGHSSLGNHSTGFENFENSQTSSLVSSSKFSKNYESTTANIRMLGDSNAMESLDSTLDSGVKSALDSKDSSSLDSTQSVESNKINPHEVRTLKACSGEEGVVKGGEGATLRLSRTPFSPFKDSRIESDNLTRDTKELEDSTLDSNMESNLASKDSIKQDSIPSLDSKTILADSIFLQKLNVKLKPYSNIAIWGAGAKGNTLANMLTNITCVIDINPNKFYCFTPKSALEILPPKEALERYNIDFILVMNPAYLDEIKSMLKNMGRDIKLESV